MWVCLQSVLADDEKENVVLLVVKYSHVVFVRLRRYAKQCWEVAGSAIAIYLTIDVGINARSTKIQYKIL